MTQLLQLEAAWEKQISPEDRHLIENCFQQIDHLNRTGISFSYIRHDFNHRQALLIIVLIHNHTDDIHTFVHRKMICLNQENKKVAEKSFSLPIEIPAKTSMPWTFIFPKGSYHDVAESSQLKLI